MGQGFQPQPSAKPRRAVTPVLACKRCSSPYVEGEYEFHLCWDCRLDLSRRPFPRMIKLVGGLVVVAIIFAATYYPDTIRASMAYEEGQRAERSKDFGRAAAEYQTVLATYPDSPVAAAHLGIAYYRAGDIQQAIWILDKLGDQNIPQDAAQKVNAVLQGIKKQAGVK